MDAYLFLFLKLQNFFVRRTRTSCFYLLPLPCYWVIVHIFVYFTDVLVRHTSLGCFFCYVCFLFNLICILHL